MMDYTSGILDEIALEGLDGITIEALWTRLQKRPDFILPPFDDHSKRYLWNIVRRLRNIEFYELPEPRPPLVLYNRYDNIDPEIGIVIEPDPPPLDIYPHCIINDAVKSVIGSCSTYYTRHKVMVRRLSLDEVVDKYGNKLVIVASQHIRFRALIGLQSNPTLEISPAQYCILERIGRARYHGEVTQGKVSLQLIGADPKSIFYFRKFLLKHGLITKQVFHLKSHNQSLTGLLLHLTRFHTLVKMKYATITENIVKFLKEQPNNVADYTMIKESLGVTDLKRLLKMPEFQKVVRTDGKLPFKTLYPDLDLRPRQGKKPDKEKMVRVLSLVDPHIDMGEVQRRFEGNEDEEDDEDEKSRGIIDDRRRCLDVPILTQVYRLLMNAGSLGLAQSEIARRLGMNKLQARTVCRNLLKTEAVGMYMVDIGRQRVTRYFLKHVSESVTGGLPMIPQVEMAHNSEQRFEDKKPFAPAMEYILPDYEVTEGIETTVVSEGLKDRSDMNGTLKRSGDVEYVEFISKRPKLEFTERRKSDDEYNRVPKLDEFINSSKRGKVEVDRGEEFLKRQNVEEIDLEMSVDYSYECASETLEDDQDTSGEILEESRDQVDESLPQVSVEEPNDTKRVIDVLNDPSVKIEVTDDISFKCGYGHKRLKMTADKLTLRMMRRIDLVVETVMKHRIHDLSKMLSFIKEEEEKEGVMVRMDKKSLFRILQRLVSDNIVKVYTIVMLHESGVERKLMFICEPTVSRDNLLCSSMVENAMFRFTTSLRIRETKKQKVNRETEPVKSECPSVASETSHELVSHKPKFNRMRELHKLLYYLVYGYEGSTDIDQSKAYDEIRQQCNAIEDLSETPFIYYTKADWRVFVPPLPVHREEEGWCLLVDVIMRTPLCTFLQLVRVSEPIPGLDAFINHPVKKYLLLRQLPKDLQDSLTAGRKYVFTIYDVLVRLAYIGLVQIGPQQHKDKDQVFLYVNKRGVLLDTTASKPGYHRISEDIEYPVHNYLFESTLHVDEYWHDMWKICMHTKLGGRNCIQGTELVFESLQDKVEMIEATRPREFAEAEQLDIGVLPGDRLGAAGFDSMLFSHLKRNWSQKPHVKQSFGGTMSISKRQTTAHAFLAKRRAVRSSLMRKLVNPVKRSLTSHEQKKQSARRKVVRVRQMKPRQLRNARRPYYDQIDKEALSKMSKLRVDWSKEEDRLLIMCKVASLFLCPTQVKVCSNLFLVVREVLHEAYACARNKTSRACQRRVVFMMKSPSTCYNISLMVEELRQDPNIVARYGSVTEDIRKQAEIAGKTLNEMDKQWNTKFKELVAELRLRYSKSALIPMESEVELPETVSEFDEKFQLIIPELKVSRKTSFKPIQSIDDIRNAVLKTVIQSTLSCSNNTPSWSYHLFSIYQQYPEKLLRNAINELRKSMILSLKKFYQKSQLTRSYLPLTASPFQLSITYVNLIQNKYQTELFTSCSKEYDSFVESRGEKVELPPTVGATATAIQFLSSNVVEFDLDIPNQIIVLDPNVKHKDESYSRLVQRYQDILSRYKKKLLTSSVLFEKENYSTVDSDSVKPDEKNSMNYQNAVAKAASRIALFMVNEDSEDRDVIEPKEMQHAHDFFVVNSCKIYIKYPGEVESSRVPRLMGVPDDETLQAIYDRLKSSTVLSELSLDSVDLSKEVPEDSVELAKSILERCEHRAEFGLTKKEVVDAFGNSSQVESVLTKLEELQFLLRVGVLETRYVHYSYNQPWVLESHELLHEEEEHNGTEKKMEGDVDDAPNLELEPMEVEEIPPADQSNGEDSPRPGTSKDVDSPDELPKDSELPVSVVECKSVNRETVEALKHSKPIKVLIKPWVQINGTLNHTVLDCFLRTVFCHIMTYPGISLAEVQAHFTPAIQPQHVVDLCDILSRIGCVAKSFVREVGSVSLFSQPRRIEFCKATGLEDTKEILYEADKSGITKLAKFLDKFPNKGDDYLQFLVGK